MGESVRRGGCGGCGNVVWCRSDVVGGKVMNLMNLKPARNWQPGDGEVHKRAIGVGGALCYVDCDVNVGWCKCWYADPVLRHLGLSMNNLMCKQFSK